jgi:ceramide glucosyltransferase
MYFSLIVIGIYTVVMILRFIFTFLYYKREDRKMKNIEEVNKLSLKELTIFQPILSGDKYLKEKLSFVFENAGEAEIIWAVDEDDSEAEKIINEITKGSSVKNLHVVKCSKAPFSENPKVYKIIQTEKLWRKYTVILDDDTITDIKALEKTDKRILETSIVTGIPYYLKAGNIWENLIRAYVNSNSAYNYFTSAFLGKNKTINGMFYLFKSEKIISLKLYEKIRQKLCDDYELAKIAGENGIGVYQSVIPCRLNTEVRNFTSFIKLMRRWHIFVNHYIKENTDVSVIIFSVIPFVSGSLFLLISLFYKHEIFYVYIVISLINALAGKKIRKIIFGEDEKLSDIVLEMFSSVIQIFYWFLALAVPNRIVWRGKTVKIKDGIIEVKQNEKKDKG